MKIANLTQHKATPDQIAAGVAEPEGDWKAQIAFLLTFNELPTENEILSRAVKIALYARDMECDAAMIGGAPYLMGSLEMTLRQIGVKPLYAFSERRSVEREVDGKVEKSTVFQHVGFVEAVELVERAIQ